MWIIIAPNLLRLFAPKYTGGLSLYPFIFLHAEELRADAEFMQHERIHLRQQAEMLLVFFLAWYAFEFCIRLFRYKNGDRAYRNISFEREAYANENDPEYLKTRNFWAFLKYI